MERPAPLGPHFGGRSRSGGDKYSSLLLPHGKNQPRTKVQFNRTRADAVSHVHSGLEVFCLKYTISTGLMDEVKCISKNITMRAESRPLCDPIDCSRQAPLSIGFFRQEYWSGKNITIGESNEHCTGQAEVSRSLQKASGSKRGRGPWSGGPAHSVQRGEAKQNVRTPNRLSRSPICFL